MYTYPVKLTALDNGQFMAEFPDVPQALTYGESEALALEWAKDALHESLDQYMDMKLAIPKPSRITGHSVSVDPMAGIKLCIYQNMLDKGINQEKLAALLNCDARQIRRLLDIFHNSTLEQVTLALAVLGLGLEMTARPLLSTRQNAYA